MSRTPQREHGDEPSAPRGARTFYRIIRYTRPRLRDLLSHEARGLALRNPTPRAQYLATGVSVYDDLEWARKQARGFHLGRSVAAIAVETGDPVVQVEQTTDDRHHFTIWADPVALLARVSFVVPV